MLTTNILPKLITTALQNSQLSVLYIVVSVLVANFYFLNLILAVVYDGYLEHKREVSPRCPLWGRCRC